MDRENGTPVRLGDLVIMLALANANAFATCVLRRQIKIGGGCWTLAFALFFSCGSSGAVEFVFSTVVHL